MYPTPPRNPRDNRPAPKARLSRADADARLRMRGATPVAPAAARPAITTPTPVTVPTRPQLTNTPTAPAPPTPQPAYNPVPQPYRTVESAQLPVQDLQQSAEALQPPAQTRSPAGVAKALVAHATALPLKKIGIGFASLAVIAGIGFGALHFLGGAGQTAVVPKETKQKVTYGVFEPQKNKVLQIDKKSVEFDEKNKIITYSALTNDQVKLIFSEQPTPDSFVDVPQAFDKLISSLQGYTSFDSVNGKVNLTHPKELKGQQAAVLNNKGTLMFVRATGNVSDDTWRQIFNNLEVVK